MGQLIIFAIFGVLMYVLLILPQQRRMKEQQALLASLNEGDHVLTTSGIYGNIIEFEGPVLWLEVAKGVEIKVAREAVTGVIGDPADGSSETDTSAKKSRLEKFQESLTGETSGDDDDGDSAADGADNEDAEMEDE